MGEGGDIWGLDFIRRSDEAEIEEGRLTGHQLTGDQLRHPRDSVEEGIFDTRSSVAAASSVNAYRDVLLAKAKGFECVCVERECVCGSG